MALKIKIKVCVATLAVVFSAVADANAPLHSYSNGFSIVEKMGGDLAEALPDKYGNLLPDKPVTLQPEASPVIAPVVMAGDNKEMREICVSAGFLDLMNHIAHAKAIENVQPGFMDSYVLNLSRDASGALKLPDIVDARYWTDDVINDQISYFNQMVSMLMAINLSHHYLGHYAKYADRLIGPNNKAVPINELLTESEWEVSLKAGAHNSLDCAMATEGLKALFEAIGKMPQRPTWTDYIIPPNADTGKLNKELDRYEHDFFHGGLR